MGNLDIELHRHECAGDGAVYVAHDDDPVGLVLEAHGLEPLHDPRRLSRVGQTPHLEVDVRPGDIQLFEKQFAHVLVIMLAGMYQQRLKTALRLEGPHQRRNLHKIRPRPAYTNYLYHLIPLLSSYCYCS